mmetsp:Transcript_21004/g.31554  ORF Transcript_21004/g.31554 Transcript_21004/m.31554 type:complete len:111 (-) Transcript_21004:61-393(-)
MTTNKMIMGTIILFRFLMVPSSAGNSNYSHSQKRPLLTSFGDGDGGGGGGDIHMDEPLKKPHWFLMTRKKNSSSNKNPVIIGWNFCSFAVVWFCLRRYKCKKCYHFYLSS